MRENGFIPVEVDEVLFSVEIEEINLRGQSSGTDVSIHGCVDTTFL
jgi:hypothetical protein